MLQKCYSKTHYNNHPEITRTDAYTDTLMLSIHLRPLESFSKCTKNKLQSAELYIRNDFNLLLPNVAILIYE